MKSGSVASINWLLRSAARKRGLDVGRGQGYSGWSLFAEAHELAWMPPRFVIEYRGEEYPPVRIAESYSGHADRQKAFGRIVDLFTRLSVKR